MKEIDKKGASEKKKKVRQKKGMKKKKQSSRLTYLFWAQTLIKLVAEVPGGSRRDNVEADGALQGFLANTVNNGAAMSERTLAFCRKIIPVSGNRGPFL